MPSPIKLGARGDRVEPLQKGINTILGNREFKWRRVPVDGVAGPATFKSAHLALWLIGASEDQLRKVRHNERITPRAFDLLTGGERSEAMKKRDKARQDEAAELRKEHRHSATVASDGTARYVSPSGVEWRVAAWMVGAAVGPDGQKRDWLHELQRHGWDGELYSAFRSPTYSRSLCENMCGAPSCPGLCAGEASNHSQTGPPNWGALDVKGYEAFQRACNKINAPFTNHLPADLPHRSYTGY